MIDIVGLQISTAEFLWTVISFFLFMFLLNKFLFDPILKVMDARNARINEGIEEGKLAQKALDESKEELAAELSAAGGEARALISDARSDAEKAKSAVLGTAHAEAAAVQKTVREKLAAEESEEISSVENEMPELIAVLTCRLLGGHDVTGENDLIRDCVESSKSL